MNPRTYRHNARLLNECSTWRDRDKPDGWAAEFTHEVATSLERVSCYWCRGEWARRSRAVRKRPDLPPNPGRCALCNGDLPGRRRSWCSDGCVAVWLGTTNGPTMAHHLATLHGEECWRCGARWQPGRRMPWSEDLGPPLPTPVALEVDHVRPLWSLTEEERGQPRWWLPFNLQLLCVSCHKDKTREEAAERARLRRARLTLGV